MAETLGACGYVFVDYGEKHHVTDLDGKVAKKYEVVNIDHCMNPVVMINDDNNRLSYKNGDFVKFTGVEGMT